MKTTISIDKIEVSISGLSTEIVKKSFAHFDKELSLQASKLIRGNCHRVHNSETVDAGSLPVHHDIQPAHLRKMVADRILRSIVQESL